jgi:hypothetical protein
MKKILIIDDDEQVCKMVFTRKSGIRRVGHAIISRGWFYAG